MSMATGFSVLRIGSKTVTLLVVTVTYLTYLITMIDTTAIEYGFDMEKYP